MYVEFSLVSLDDLFIRRLSSRRRSLPVTIAASRIVVAVVRIATVREQIQQMTRIHRFQAHVVLVDDGVGNADLEVLQTHDLLFEGAYTERDGLRSSNRLSWREGGATSSEDAIDVDGALLSESMGSVHSLQIVHGIPIVFEEHHDVGRRQIQSEAAHFRRQQQHIDCWIRIELRDNSAAIAGRNGSVDAQVGDTRWHQQLLLDDVQQSLQLSEDQHSMGSTHLLSQRRSRASDAAVEEQLVQHLKLGCVDEVGQSLPAERFVSDRDAECLCRERSMHGVGPVQRQQGVAAQLSEVLQRLQGGRRHPFVVAALQGHPDCNAAAPLPGQTCALAKSSYSAFWTGDRSQ